MEEKRKLIKAANRIANRLEIFNKRFPSLATEVTQASLEEWQNIQHQYGSVEMEKSSAEEEVVQEKLRALAIELLESHGLEDVQDMLLSEYQMEIETKDLVELVGNDSYMKMLRRDASQLLANAISYDQVATLWNDLNRPSLGADHWNAQSVSILVE
ncbi:MAG: hypothetical protein GY696_09165 [Gammaproteobacteria bacterium]|nr:hypothetical protein [Gammaproteobacteria bacterium]